MQTSLHARQSKTVLDSGIQPLYPGFKVMDSTFQSIVRFRIPWFVFRIPDSRIHKQTFPRFRNFPWGIAPCKRIRDSLGFWIPRRIFPIPDTGFYILCQGNWDSGLQSLVGFCIPWAVFRVPKPRIPDSTNQIFLIPDCTSKIFPDSQIRIRLHGAKDRF